MESHSLERVTAFTDGAVAIALTLLVLPLVDVSREVAVKPVGAVVDEHGVDFLAFALSFFVIALFWRVHRRIFETIERFDEPLLLLNTCWLLGVVFLPVPTAVLIFQVNSATGATVLYLTNLLFVALMGLALSTWVHWHPALQVTDAAAEVRYHIHRAAVACALIAMAAALAFPLGTNALYLLLALPVAEIVSERLYHD